MYKLGHVVSVLGPSRLISRLAHYDVTDFQFYKVKLPVELKTAAHRRKMNKLNVPSAVFNVYEVLL